MDQPAKRYHYTAIPESSIRLIEFLPDSQPGTIKCRLQIHPLATCPPYTALSYMWGPEHPQTAITVDGSSLQIRDNLASFLNTMTKKRLKKKLRWKETQYPFFWIDQICIDQSNNQERSHQVKLMHDIFSNAQLVTIWLGQASKASDAAMKFLSSYRVSILAKLPHGWYHEKLSPFSSEYLLRSAYKAFVPSARLVEAAHTLRDSPYWSRVWVLQEVICARDCVLSCGDKSIPWRNLTQYDALKKPYLPSGHDMFLPCIIARSLSYSNATKRRWELEWLLMDFHASKCTDPRDRIFAVLGLLPKDTMNGDKLPTIEPEYDKTNFEVYEDVIQYLQRRKKQDRNSLGYSITVTCVILLLKALEVQLCPENYFNSAKFLKRSGQEQPLLFDEIMAVLADGRENLAADPCWPTTIPAVHELSLILLKLDAEAFGCRS